ncbi:MAG: phosphoglycerate kinase [Candidatus Margulisbacteria bacterium]|nr:phosphoglycerate kinase [Candidatus Margulisiibacteriota bacterium]
MRKRFADLLQEPIAGKVVLVRVDFNVPISNGVVTDSTRILSSVGTIQALLEKQARVVLIAHLNRPKGTIVESDRLTPVAKALEPLIKCPVKKVDDCIGASVQSSINALNNSELLMLENIRFHPGEESNDAEFSKTLASYADFFVQDAFGAVHRSHASTVGVAKHLPSYSGALLDKELTFLSELSKSPKRPFCAIIGGSKISTKFSVLRRLIDVVDVMVVGGAMVYTLLLAQGKSVGKSLAETDLLDQAREFLAHAEAKKKHLIIPSDHVVVTDIQAPQTAQVVTTLAPEHIGVDIGPASVQIIQDVLTQSKTIFWNGPLGIFEVDAYAKGTMAIANAIANCPQATTVVGGGDSISAINVAGVADKMDHVSTGGGASLEFLEGKQLPGIEVLG